MHRIRKALTATLVAVGVFLGATALPANPAPVAATCNGLWQVIPPQGGSLLEPTVRHFQQIAGSGLDNRVLVAIRGTDNVIWITTLNVASGLTHHEWQNSWEYRGGQTMYVPKVSFYGSGSSTVARIIVLGTDGNTWQNRYSPAGWPAGWTGWEILGNGASIYNATQSQTYVSTLSPTLGNPADWYVFSNYLTAPIYRCDG